MSPTVGTSKKACPLSLLSLRERRRPLRAASPKDFGKIEAATCGRRSLNPLVATHFVVRYTTLDQLLRGMHHGSLSPKPVGTFLQPLDSGTLTRANAKPPSTICAECKAAYACGQALKCPCSGSEVLCSWPGSGSSYRGNFHHRSR